MADSFDTIRTNATLYTTSVLAAATMQIDQALGILGGLTDGGEQNIPTINVNVPEAYDPGAAPTYTGAHWERPILDAFAPTLLNLPSLVFPAAPVHIDQTITYTDPIRPSGGPSRSIIGAAPDVEVDIDIPAAPDLLSEINGIVAPTITQITIPDAPTYNAPTFDGQRPTITATAPTNLDATFRAAFDEAGGIMRAVNQDALEAFLDRDFPSFRAALVTLEEKLADYLEGGTALTATVQDAIYTRLQDKTNTEGRRARDTAIAEFARSGQTLPSPIIAAQLQTIDQAGRDNNVRGAIDLAIKIAELEQQNMQFAITASTQLRQIALTAAMQYYGGLVQTNGQAIEYARGIVGAIVDTYDIAAKIAQAQANLYETDARVYESKQKAALAVMEAYAVQVRGLEAQANVDTARVNQYKARIDAVQAEANVYQALIQGYTAQAQIRRLQVDIYQAKVQAFGAEVNAYTAQWQGYEAAVKGETARIDGLKAQESVFLGQVQAYEAEVRAKAVEITAVSSANESAVKVYNAEVNAFSALVQAEGAAIKAEVDSFGEELKAYVANAQAYAEKSRANIAAYQVGHQAMIETARLFYSNLLEKAKLHEARLKAAADIAASGAAPYARVAAAVASGMVTLGSDNTNRTA